MTNTMRGTRAEDYLKKVANDSFPELATFTYKETLHALKLAKEEERFKADTYWVERINNKAGMEVVKTSARVRAEERKVYMKASMHLGIEHAKEIEKTEKVVFDELEKLDLLSPLEFPYDGYREDYLELKKRFLSGTGKQQRRD